MLTGTLKKFFAEKGFGFIAQDNGGADLFAHKRALQGADESSIREGSKVTYLAEVEDRTNKPKASTWRVLDAGLAGAAISPELAAQAAMLGATAIPDYSALAAASFGAVQAAAAGNLVSPYGAMGLAMPSTIPGLGTPGLPLGWEQVADPTTGKPYYCNRATGESSWTIPVATAPTAMPTAMPAFAPLAAAPITETLPAGWEQATDPATQKTYYFNRASGETTWTPPVAAAPVATAPVLGTEPAVAQPAPAEALPALTTAPAS
jgi:cold shock CspA family protein